MCTLARLRLICSACVCAAGMASVASSVLLAKSEGDELLEEIFLQFPLAFFGLVLGFFVREYVKNLKPLQFDYNELPQELVLAPPDLPVVRNGPTITLNKPELPEVGLPSLPDLGEYAELLSYALIPAVAVGFVAAGDAGILNTLSGVAMKAGFDGWNVFAGVFLPGALLKY